MSIKECKTALLKEVGHKVASIGFCPKARGQSFYKKSNLGLESIHLSFYTSRTDFDVTVDVAIRVDLIEDAVNVIRDHLSARKKAKTFTMGAELGNMKQGFRHKYFVFGLNDVSRIADFIFNAIKETGIPFFKKYEDLEEIYSILCRDDRSAWLVCPLHSERAMSAIALSKILQKENTRELIENKRKFLNSINYTFSYI